MNYIKLLEHLAIAITLGTISSGIFEQIKSKFFPSLTGGKLRIVSIIATGLIGLGVGAYYGMQNGTLDRETLIVTTIWVVVGAQGVYEVVKLATTPKEEKEMKEFIEEINDKKIGGSN